MHSLEIRGAEQNSNLDESITDESKNVNSYSREPESITELRRQNERLHIDAEKAATLYGNARVIMPKIPRSRNGFIASANLKNAQIEWQAHRTAYSKRKP